MLELKNQIFYEDLDIGYSCDTSGRTIDYADVINCGAISGDLLSPHFDVEYAKSSPLGNQIAHGICAMALGTGLFMMTDFASKTNKTLLDVLELRELRFTTPVYFGDTITLNFEIVGKTDLDDTKGSIEIEFTARKQTGEICQVSRMEYLFAKRNYDFEGIASRGQW